MFPAILIAAFTFAVVIVSGFGIDRQNTIAVSGVTDACASIVALAVACYCFWLAYRESQADRGDERLSRLRKTTPGAWAWRVGLFVLFFALLAGVSTRHLLSVAVWYAPGTSQDRVATILSMRPVYGRGRTCDIRGSARLADGAVKPFCYVGGLVFTHRISDANLGVGDSVIVTIKRNLLGTAIVSIRPTP